MILCVQTNKYSKLHKCLGPEHVESIFKEFQVAPRGIKKLISLQKEARNSNVKTHTWKSFPLQREQVTTKPTGLGGGGVGQGREFCGVAASEANNTARSRVCGNFSCKRKICLLWLCLWAMGKTGRKLRLGAQWFFFFFPPSLPSFASLLPSPNDSLGKTYKWSP